MYKRDASVSHTNLLEQMWSTGQNFL